MMAENKTFEQVHMVEQKRDITSSVEEYYRGGCYEEAKELLDKIRGVDEAYTDQVAIYDASIHMELGYYDIAFTALRCGLKYNYANFELYILLGEYYLRNNPNQAYLCFENALFFCQDEEDKRQIKAMMQELRDNYEVTVRNVSFIILSYNLLDYLKICIDSIRTNVAKEVREIVVVDNASTDGSVEWLEQQTDIVLRRNLTNSGFPKGCNEGIECANCENDLFLLNNDTEVPPNALFWLRMGLYEDEKVGMTGSITNYAGNMQSIRMESSEQEEMMAYAIKNNVPMSYPYEEKLYLIGFALLIRRELYEEIGGLDERFSPGNYEDNDYGLRSLEAGYRNFLCYNSFILHFGSKSFGKAREAYNQLMTVNAEKFKNKWQIDASYYFYPRIELVEQIVEDRSKEMNVLDIGCGCGAISCRIRSQYTNAKTYGIEISKQAAKIAACGMEVLCGDVEELEFPWPDEFFDYVIMGDVLEHLREPAEVLVRLKRHIKKDGYIIVSMPNMKHFSVMLPLIMNDCFSYTDSGILDRTHLKMYTATEMLRMIIGSGYEVERIQYTTYGEPDEEQIKQIDALVSMAEGTDRTVYLAYQYIIKAKVS